MRRGKGERDPLPESLKKLKDFHASNIGSISNAADSDGWTALHLASFLTFPSASKCVEFLLQSGADHSLKNLDGQTALHLAAANGSEKIVRLLISYGSPVRCPNTLHAFSLLHLVD
jgi:ankyrin repeat protein